MAVQDAPISQRDGWLTRSLKAAMGRVFVPWAGLAAFVVIFMYSAKYVMAAWYFTGHVKANMQDAWPLTSLYWEMVGWFLGIGLALWMLELIARKSTTIGWMRSQALGAGILFFIFAPITWFLVVGMTEDSLVWKESNYVGAEYGPAWQLDWWQIGEVLIAGETCEPHHSDWQNPDRKVVCYTGFTNKDERLIRNADAPEAPWYSFL